MKNLIIFLICSLAYSQDRNIESKNINSYINTFFLNEANLTLKNVPSYLAINLKDYKKLPNDKQSLFWDYLNMMNQVVRDELKKCNSDYSIVSHSEMEVENLKSYRVDYVIKEKIYYLVCNEKIITLFILDSNRNIICFCIDPFNSHGGKITPLMLDSIK